MWNWRTRVRSPINAHRRLIVEKGERIAHNGEMEEKDHLSLKSVKLRKKSIWFLIRRTWVRNPIHSNEKDMNDNRDKRISNRNGTRMNDNNNKEKDKERKEKRKMIERGRKIKEREERTSKEKRKRKRKRVKKRKEKC